METLNIFDKNFIPYDPCSTHGKTPKNITFVKDQRNWEGITIYTDHCFQEVFNTKSRINVAWQVESPVHSDRQFYPMLKYADKFDKIITYDEELINKYPEKFLRGNFGGTTVDNFEKVEKTKEICIVHSGKKDTPNHHLRQKIIDEMATKYNIDVYGRVTGKPFHNVYDVYKDYRHVIVIENVNHPNYFSEKLTDAMVCDCRVLYNGSIESVERYFPYGIVPWKTIEDLEFRLERGDINKSGFDQSYPIRYDNRKIVMENFYTNEDWLWENYLKYL